MRSMRDGAGQVARARRPRCPRLAIIQAHMLWIEMKLATAGQAIGQRLEDERRRRAG